MDEYNFRVSLQRRVLEKVNSLGYPEQLAGLSSGSIERFRTNSNINNEIISVLKEIGKKLFFLSTKSQDQVSGSYQVIKDELEGLSLKLDQSLAKATRG